MHRLLRLTAAFVGVLLLAMVALIAFTEPTPAESDVTVLAGPGIAHGAIDAVPAPLGWTPPDWFPDEARSDLWVLENLDQAPTHRWGPKVRAPAGIIADLDRGEVLWARDPDASRSIASVTKLVSSLTLMSYDADLDREVCLGLEQWPTRPGARSKFETGDCYAGWEYLGAALVASDNRGAFAMPAIADQDYFDFVDKMGEVADELGLRAASFADPAGLEDENMASARDILKAVTAVSVHPVLNGVASAPVWRIDTRRGPRVLNTTNRILALSLTPPKKKFVPPPFATLAAKTGYTDTAHYCFAIVAESLSTGRRYGAVLLGAPNNSARFDDMLAMLNWADKER
ncbi:MAG: hypothetical protein ABMB14_38205 [Myxococcota bacterium]